MYSPITTNLRAAVLLAFEHLFWSVVGDGISGERTAKFSPLICNNVTMCASSEPFKSLSVMSLTTCTTECYFKQYQLSPCIGFNYRTSDRSCEIFTKDPGNFTKNKAGCQYYQNARNTNVNCTVLLDINECLTANGGCDMNAACTNTIGSRTCQCHAGFTGDGVNCTDIDECFTGNGGCATNAICTNTVGSRTCECDCQAGLYRDGLNCTTGYTGILLQQHCNGSTFFQRTWNEFKAGFGNVNSNYWIGNEQLHTLTSSGQYRLRVDLQARANCQWYWAEYSKFIVDSETNFYRLSIGGYSGTAGDALTVNDAYHNLNGMMFTTLDADHDQCPSCNCAITPVVGHTCGGGFWNKGCNVAWINTPNTCGFMWQGLPTADTKLMYTRLTLI